MRNHIHCVKSVQIRIFSGPYFSAFGLNREIYYVNLSIQFKYRKYGPEKTPYLDTFHAVICFVTPERNASRKNHW